MKKQKFKNRVIYPRKVEPNFFFLEFMDAFKFWAIEKKAKEGSNNA